MNKLNLFNAIILICTIWVLVGCGPSLDDLESPTGPKTSSMGSSRVSSGFSSSNGSSESSSSRLSSSENKSSDKFSSSSFIGSSSSSLIPQKPLQIVALSRIENSMADIGVEVLVENARQLELQYFCEAITWANYTGSDYELFPIDMNKIPLSSSKSKSQFYFSVDLPQSYEISHYIVGCSVTNTEDEQSPYFSQAFYLDKNGKFIPSSSSIASSSSRNFSSFFSSSSSINWSSSSNMVRIPIDFNTLKYGKVSLSAMAYDPKNDIVGITGSKDGQNLELMLEGHSGEILRVVDVGLKNGAVNSLVYSSYYKRFYGGGYEQKADGAQSRIYNFAYDPGTIYHGGIPLNSGEDVSGMDAQSNGDLCVAQKDKGGFSSTLIYLSLYNEIDYTLSSSAFSGVLERVRAVDGNCIASGYKNVSGRRYPYLVSWDKSGKIISEIKISSAMGEASDFISSLEGAAEVVLVNDEIANWEYAGNSHLLSVSGPGLSISAFYEGANTVKMNKLTSLKNGRILAVGYLKKKVNDLSGIPSAFMADGTSFWTPAIPSISGSPVDAVQINDGSVIVIGNYNDGTGWIRRIFP